MCRHLAYLGPPRSPAELLFDAQHSLAKQAYAPADMRGAGTVNVDGFGLGWYPGTSPPLRYRRAGPIWADQTLAELAPATRSGAFLAAVRSATPGMPVSEAACAPFTGAGLLFSHNGFVTGWPDSMAGPASTLPVTELLRLAAPTDSVLLWQLLLARLRSGENPLDAVLGLVADTSARAPGSRLNLLLTDGETLVATAWSHALSMIQDERSVLIASEPCDARGGWTRIPDRHAVHATAGSVNIVEIRTEG